MSFASVEFKIVSESVKLYADLKLCIEVTRKKAAMMLLHLIDLRINISTDRVFKTCLIGMCKDSAWFII